MYTAKLRRQLETNTTTASTGSSSSPAMQVPLLRLQCGVNSYEWGKMGSSSAAAKYAAATPAADFSVKEDQPYAEVSIGYFHVQLQRMLT